MEHNSRAFFRTAALACVAVAALTVSSAMPITQNNLPVCPLIATGGTIAMKIDPVKEGAGASYLWRGSGGHGPGLPCQPTPCLQPLTNTGISER
jgi:L-asparaginase/Glu-tRNA(Gln) amidotransferase subunit D